jgi:hypothetical protein
MITAVPTSRETMLGIRRRGPPYASSLASELSPTLTSG